MNGDQTPYHMLYVYPAVMEKKQRFREAPFAEPKEIAQPPTDYILKFIGNTGLM